jgi:hypothetical protein
MLEVFGQCFRTGVVEVQKEFCLGSQTQLAEDDPNPNRLLTGVRN